MAQVFDALALLHITDRAAYADFTNFDGDAALPKELARACSLLVKLPKLSTGGGPFTETGPYTETAFSRETQ